jgi:hypothetical protein
MSRRTRGALFWALDGEGNPVPLSEREAWRAMVGDDRILLQSRVSGWLISTIFLGIDYGHGWTEQPILFETMIFGGPRDGWLRRSCTRDEALAAHSYALALVEGIPAAVRSS